ncbi:MULTISPECIES: restriction endonuclease subunit S [unclassified Mycobacterium]|uniref:restriction endonuclease subunit S n=1 Tax=unclassified Mycobacterium TaxID=2642494 RepID=UPI0029C76E1A|nr:MULTISPECIES: restriction endonuclease subunit S [unclassified Mycobacterium]
MATLGELAKSGGQYGVGLSSRTWRKGDPRYIRITDIRDDGNLNSDIVAPDGERQDWAKAVLHEGDLLFARSGATVGKTYIHSAGSTPAVYAGYLIRFQVDTDRVLPRYVFRFTQSSGYRAWVASAQRAVAQPNINAKQYAALPIPLPPLDEQRRIAAILDHADALRVKRLKLVHYFASLMQSTFHTTFGSIDAPTATVRRARLDEMVRVSTGATPSRSEASNYGGGIPWVKTGEVRGEITGTEETVSEAGIKDARLRIFPVNSVVVAMYGQGTTRGRCGILRTASAVNQACAVLEPSSELDSEFLLMQMQLGYQRLRAMARGGNQPNLNLELVRSFEVLSAPLEAQKKFRHTIEQIRVQESIVKRQAAHLHGLFASLQSRAFSGQL